MSEAETSEQVSTGLTRVMEAARKNPHGKMLSLCHHIDVAALERAYHRIRKDAAVGVDGVTKEEYGQGLEQRLADLHGRMKAMKYRHQPIRRVHIPKGKDQTRPIGVSSTEDKIVQGALRELLEAVYEQDFLECSYGFRPGRSGHDAIKALNKSIRHGEANWILEADIASFFDNISHSHLRSFLDQRVRDGILRRTIHKWLKAGVMESGSIKYPDAGSPQGGVVSPILANIYLHEVMDKWFTQEVRPRLKGRGFLLRYADDQLIVCEREEDARRIMEVLPKRFGRFELELHPEKTRLVDFRKPRLEELKGNGTFDFLGFTHYWGKSRMKKWVVMRKTAKDRLNRSVARVNETCRKHRHDELKEQQDRLIRMVRGGTTRTTG